jgi:hypothetical protein
VCCAFCGGGDKWIKTCRARDGTRLRLCDPCYEVLARWFMIVPGDWVAAARCDHCGRYGHPRDFRDASPGGRKGAFSGTCPECAGQIEGDVKKTSPIEGLLNPGPSPGMPQPRGIWAESL